MSYPPSPTGGRPGNIPTSGVGNVHSAAFTDNVWEMPTSGPSTLHLHPSTSYRPQSTRASTNPSPASSRSATPYSLGIYDDHTPDESGNAQVHPTLRKSIRPADYNYLLKLKPQLTETNYSTWQTNIHRALETESLHTYLDPTFTRPDINKYPKHSVRWNKANLFVCTVLTSTMTEMIASQIGHIHNAAEMWAEAKQLYLGTTAWTPIVTVLVTTGYTDGEDVAVHIAKMKKHRRELILMGRDTADDLFACFLRISMPPTWNYVFATLPDHYTSTEVERRIRDEYGVRMSQSASSKPFQATKSKTRKRHGHHSIPPCTKDHALTVLNVESIVLTRAQFVGD